MKKQKKVRRIEKKRKITKIRKKTLPISANFIDGNGKKGNGVYAVLPICQYEDNSKRLIKFIGTAFFIKPNGVFLTAKHVIEDQNGNFLPNLFTVHFNEDKTCLLRDILNLASHPIADIAAGSLGTYKNSNKETLINKCLQCDYSLQPSGELISTFAYPKTEKYPYKNKDLRKLQFDTEWEFGHIKEVHPEGRDRVMLPGPCYRTDMKIEHGASGGPVMNSKGKVIGINSTGFDGTKDFYVSSLKSALELKIPNVYFNGKKLSDEITLGDLLKL